MVQDGKSDRRVEGLVRVLQLLGAHLRDLAAIGHPRRGQDFSRPMHRLCADIEGAHFGAGSGRTSE